MLDFLNMYDNAFLRRRDGHLLFLRSWRRGYQVSEAERQKLTKCLGPLTAFAFFGVVAHMPLCVAFGDRLHLPDLLVPFVIIIPWLCLVSGVSILVLRSVLRGRPVVATGMTFQEYWNRAWQLMSLGPFLLMLVGGMLVQMLVLGVLEGSTVASFISLAAFLGVLIPEHLRCSARMRNWPQVD